MGPERQGLKMLDDALDDLVSPFFLDDLPLTDILIVIEEGEARKRQGQWEPYDTKKPQRTWGHTAEKFGAQFGRRHDEDTRRDEDQRHHSAPTKVARLSDVEDGHVS